MTSDTGWLLHYAVTSELSVQDLVELERAVALGRDRALMHGADDVRLVREHAPTILVSLPPDAAGPDQVSEAATVGLAVLQEVLPEPRTYGALLSIGMYHHGDGRPDTLWRPTS